MGMDLKREELKIIKEGEECVAASKSNSRAYLCGAGERVIFVGIWDLQRYEPT